MEKISNGEAFRTARNIAKKKSPKATFLLDYAVSKDKRDYLNLCYGYLRWVDDVVDDPTISLSEKNEFINRQRLLIKSYQNNFEEIPTTIEEYFLYYFIEFASKNNLKELIDSVSQMVETISWDVNRLEKDGLFSQEQLNNYINTQSKSIADILYNFVSVSDHNKKNYNNYDILTANTRLFMIRDLEEDISAGFINISEEDIKKYNLDITNLKQDRNLSTWIENQINSILDDLYIESSKVKLFPMKVKIFQFYSNIYYIPKIIRYKIYGYYIGSSIRRSTGKEIKTYWVSTLISLKLCNNIFLKVF